jgi:hypothetical protein
MDNYMSIKVAESALSGGKLLKGKGSSSFPRIFLIATRTVRSTRVWKPSHLRPFVGQVINRKRNERASYSDDEYLKEAVAWLERGRTADWMAELAGDID